MHMHLQYSKNTLQDNTIRSHCLKNSFVFQNVVVNIIRFKKKVACCLYATGEKGVSFYMGACFGLIVLAVSVRFFSFKIETKMNTIILL